MPNINTSSSSSNLLSGRKYLFGGIGVFILILVVMLTVYLFTSSSSGDEAFVLDNFPFFAGRNNLAQNLQRLLNDNLSLVNLNTDLRNDSLFESCSTCNTDFVRLKKGKVGSQFWVAQAGCGSSNRMSNIIEQLDVLNRIFKNYTSYLQLVKTSNDLGDSFENKKLGSLLFVDGGPQLNGSTALLRVFYDLGVRAMTLGSGCNDTNGDLIQNNENLSDFGKICVLEMNKLGMMIDIQNLSSSVQEQILNMTRAPVLMSHTASKTVYNIEDNIDNSTLMALKANDGLLMITFDTYNLKEDQDNVTISDVIKHLNFITELIGFDNVAIGGNYDSEYGKPQGLKDVSDFPNLFKALNWTTPNLEKLAYYNFKRFFKNVENAKNL